MVGKTITRTDDCEDLWYIYNRDIEYWRLLRQKEQLNKTWTDVVLLNLTDKYKSEEWYEYEAYLKEAGNLQNAQVCDHPFHLFRIAQWKWTRKPLSGGSAPNLYPATCGILGLRRVVFWEHIPKESLKIAHPQRGINSSGLLEWSSHISHEVVPPPPPRYLGDGGGVGGGVWRR